MSFQSSPADNAAQHPGAHSNVVSDAVAPDTDASASDTDASNTAAAICRLPNFLRWSNCRCAVSDQCPNRPEGAADCRAAFAPNPRSRTRNNRGRRGRGRLATQVDRANRDAFYMVNSFTVTSDAYLLGTNQLEDTEDSLRIWLSEMKMSSIPAQVVIVSRIVDHIDSFRMDHRVLPYIHPHILDDLQWISAKWIKGDYNPNDVLRGITVDPLNPNRRALDTNWPFFKDWRIFGHNDLISGECWVNRIAMMRDGAHGNCDGGISGVFGQGATSIVLSSPDTRAEYADIDMGATIKYVGTASTTEEPTPSTRLLLQSFRRSRAHAGDAIRVFRSSKLPEINVFRPRSGVRYDGLYQVMAAEELEAGRAVWRFTLSRVPGQGSIRMDQPDDQMVALHRETARQLREAARRAKGVSWEHWRVGLGQGRGREFGRDGSTRVLCGRELGRGDLVTGGEFASTKRRWIPLWAFR